MGAERYVAGTATEYYDGYAQCTWRFAFMPHESWQWIMTFFNATPANVSVDVFLRTKGQDDEYHYYSAKMHLPEIGKDARRGIQGYYDTELRFTQMVLQADP